jgi:hypothetical protein
MLKVATREIPAKDIQDQELANARALQNLQTRQNNELSAIISLEDAKAVLSNYLSEDELKSARLKNLKKQIKQQFKMRKFFSKAPCSNDG